MPRIPESEHCCEVACARPPSPFVSLGALLFLAILSLPSPARTDGSLRSIVSGEPFGLRTARIDSVAPPAWELWSGVTWLFGIADLRVATAGAHRETAHWLASFEVAQIATPVGSESLASAGAGIVSPRIRIVTMIDGERTWLLHEPPVNSYSVSVAGTLLLPGRNAIVSRVDGLRLFAREPAGIDLTLAAGHAFAGASMLAGVALDRRGGSGLFARAQALLLSALRLGCGYDAASATAGASVGIDCGRITIESSARVHAVLGVSNAVVISWHV